MSKKPGFIEKIIFSRFLMKEMYVLTLSVMVLVPSIPVYFLNIEDETKGWLYLITMPIGIVIAIICTKYLAKKRNIMFANEYRVEQPSTTTKIETLINKNKIDY